MTEPATTPTGPPPCNWPLDTQGAPGWDDADEQHKATATAVATTVLWALSGRRFGLCAVVARPELPAAHLGYGYGRVRMNSGEWFGLDCGEGGERIRLPGPVDTVTRILIDGEVLDPSEWRLIGDQLHRVHGYWPFYQNLALDTSELGTWSVAYTRGLAVPAAGQYAAGVMAAEVLKSLRNQSGCRLPARARSVAREGVDIQLIDPEAFLAGGRTGIPEVDLWLAAVNPDRLTRAPIVWSPDTDTVHP